MTVMRSVVLGCGAYLPSRVVMNAELAQTVDTSDEWIVQRTGIRERHIAAQGEYTSDLALHAARAALADAGYRGAIDRSDLAGYLNARPVLSRHGGHGASGARHHPGRRLRSTGRLLRLCLRDSDGG